MNPPVCVKCKREMSPAKNGVWWVKMRRLVVQKQPTHFTARQEPYKMTMADKWKCDSCGMEVLAGVAPGSTYHNEKFFDSLISGARKHGDEVIYEEV